MEGDGRRAWCRGGGGQGVCADVGRCESARELESEAGGGGVRGCVMNGGVASAGGCSMRGGGDGAVWRRGRGWEVAGGGRLGRVSWVAGGVGLGRVCSGL